jgi:ketol-acid reductoisomerase
VLCGGTSELIRAGFETLTRAGYPPELAYFECLHELKFIVDLIHEAGIAGMRELISDSAKWGALTVGPRIIDRSVQKRMATALRDIRSGKFAREFIREMTNGKRHYDKLLKDGKKHPIEQVGQKLRRRMSWKNPRSNK